ncbi:hypothetical protein HPB47_026149, partial [Ixodes persulcatus]
GTKWLPLLSSRYSGTKPQIKIGLHLEPDTVPEAAPASAPAGSRSAEVRPQPVNVGLPPSRAAEAEAEDLTPRLNLSEGYFQIGRQGAENYVFTVTVSFAANLNQLIHRSERASASKSGPYHFRYHLLGQEVTTEPFGSLSEPKFQPERASLRIRSSAPTLRRFFKDHPTLKMALCSRNAVVGETEVPLGDFTTESPQFSVSIEGLFQLRPVPADAEWLGSVQPEYRPIVGVHVEIREEPVHSEPRSELPERAAASGLPDVPTSLANDNERTPPRARSRDRPAPSPTRAAPLDFAAAAAQERRVLGRRRSWTGSRTCRRPLRSAERLDPEVVEAFFWGGIDMDTQSQFPFGDDCARRAEVIDLTNDREPHSFHHYVLSLDIRSLLLRAAKGGSTQCYVRYHYPFLGTTMPFRSRPPTVVRPGTSATVVGGYASYHFAANSDMVEAAFTEVPLSVDVISIDGHMERLLGTADFSLSPVLSCPTSTFVQDGSRKLGSRRVRTSKASLLDTRRSLVGELEAVVCLDDLGVTVVPPATPLQGDRTKLPQVPATPGAEGTAAYEREIFKIMTELELWKEQQEILFRSRLKEKEDAHLKAISEEWKQHDLEREAALKKRVKECKDLEDKLKSSLSSIEARERDLSLREAEVKECKDLEDKLKSSLSSIEARERDLSLREAEFGQQKSDFQFLKGRLQKETKDTIKRSLQEYEHLLGLEKKKVADLEAEQQRLRNQVSKLEKALLTAESSQRDRFTKEVQLQRDYEKLLSDKVEMLKDLHEALQQKHKFSEELQKTRSRLADCEEALRRSERQHGVQAHHDEVEALYRRAKARFELQRLEAPAAPSAPAATAATAATSGQGTSRPDTAAEASSPPAVVAPSSSPKGLESPTTPTNSLGDGGDAISEADPPQPPAMETTPTSPNHQSVEESWIEHVRRLMSERDMLLRSNVYTSQDRIIVELNRRIADTMAKHL